MCQVTVGVLGDICRAIEDGIYPYCNAIMQTLLTNLQVRLYCRAVRLLRCKVVAGVSGSRVAGMQAAGARPPGSCAPPRQSTRAHSHPSSPHLSRLRLRHAEL